MNSAWKEIKLSQFRKYEKPLIDCKKQYAEKYGADFVLHRTETTDYNSIQFEKIILLENYAGLYDEIVYLDFDVVPMHDDNFFEAWDLSKGIGIQHNTHKVILMDEVTERSQTIRSPTAKYYNAQAMLLDRGLNPKHHVVNTGIIGASKEHIEKLKYFGIRGI